MCTMPQACPTRLPAIKQQRLLGAAVSGTQVVKVRASPMWADTCYVLDQGCAHRFALLGRWRDEGLSARGAGVVTGGLLRSTRSMAAGADRGADGDLAHPWSGAWVGSTDYQHGGILVACLKSRRFAGRARDIRQQDFVAAEIPSARCRSAVLRFPASRRHGN